MPTRFRVTSSEESTIRFAAPTEHGGAGAASKQQLRRLIRNRVQAMGPLSRSEESQEICEQLLTLPQILGASTVLGFWPQLELEPDLRPVLLGLRDRGVQVLLPVVRSFSTAASASAPRMGFGLLGNPEDLQPNRWGIEEPKDSDQSLESVDVVLVPAVGVSRRGERLGHGYGYYDEVLAANRLPTVSAVFRCQLMDFVPTDDHDCPVDVVVAASQVIHRSLEA